MGIESAGERHCPCWVARYVDRTSLQCRPTATRGVVDEVFSLGPTLSARAQEWEARFQSSAKAQLSLSRSGIVTGTALPVDPATDVCPEGKSVEYRLY